MCDSLKTCGIYGYGIRITLIIPNYSFHSFSCQLDIPRTRETQQRKCLFQIGLWSCWKAFLSLLNKYINVKPTSISGIFKHVSLEFIKKNKGSLIGQEPQVSQQQSSVVSASVVASRLLPKFLIWHLYMLTVHCKPDKPFIVFYTVFFFDHCCHTKGFHTSLEWSITLVCLSWGKLTERVVIFSVLYVLESETK